MPVLLAVSGLFAARRIKLGWTDPAFLVRSGGVYYRYVVWLTVLAVFYAVAGTASLPHSFSGVQAYVRELVAPTTPLWYIFALVVYTISLAGLTKVRPLIVLGALAVLAFVVTMTGDLGLGLGMKVVQYFLFFAIGVYSAERLTAIAQRPKIGLLAAAVAAMLPILGLSAIDMPAAVEGALFIALGCLGVLVAFTAIGLLAKLGTPTRALAYFGERTLQIYVVHIPIVLGLIVASEADIVRGALSSPAVSAVYPLAISAATIALCLAAHRLLIATRCGFLFTPPVAITNALEWTHGRIMRTAGSKRRTDFDSPRSSV